MPQRNLQTYNLLQFGSIDSYRKENRLPPQSLSYAQNCRFDAGFLKGRKGYTSLLATELTGGTSIRTLLEYPYNASGTQTNRIVFYHNGTFYYMTTSDTSATAITDTWTNDLETEGIVYNNVLYVTNGTDAFASITDTTFATVTGAPLAKMVETWADKLWAAGVSSNPTTLYYTATATAASPTNITDWSTAAAGSYLVGKGGKITALKTFKNTLYIWKETDVWYVETLDLSGTYPNPIIKQFSVTGGALNQRCVTVVNNDVWFLGKDLKIRSLGTEVNYTDTDRTRDISFIIQRYLDQLDPDQSTACTTFYKGLYKLALRTTGAASNNFIFIYDTITGAWGIDKGPASQQYTTIDGNLYFVSPGTSGQIYRDENGFSENEGNYSFQFKTRLNDNDRPDIYKYARYIYLRGARSTGVITFVNLLGEDNEILESFTIAAPTSTETAVGAVTTTDDAMWGGGEFGDDVWGGTGAITTSDGPTVYRYNNHISCDSTARMFGVEVIAAISGQRIEIEQIEIKYVPRSENYYPSTY